MFWDLATLRRSGAYPALLGAFCCWIGAARTVHAAEEHAKFLEALYAAGYGDTAVLYLENLEATKRIPPDLVETIDLEKSEAYRNAAKHAYNDEQAQKLKSKSKALLETFLTTHPNHPAGAIASLANADEELEKAFYKLAVAKQKNGDKEALAEAKDALTAVRPLFVGANERFTALLAKLDENPLPKDRRLNPQELKIKAEHDRIEVGVVESRLKLGLVDFRLSETFTDLKSAERKKTLQSSLAVFEGIYRRYGMESEVGLQAALWKARVLQESGDKTTAGDIYEEVAGMEPEPNSPAAASQATADFYSQVALYALQLKMEQGKTEYLLEDLQDWIKDHKRWNRFPGYQAMAIEYARLLIAQAEKTPAQKAKLLQEVNVLLTAVSKVESPSKLDAITLRRQLSSDPGKLPGSFDEVFSLAEDAASTERWAEARAGYEKAIEFAVTAKNEQNADAARKRLNEVKLIMAWADFKENKKDEALKVARELMNGAVDDPQSARGADLAMAIVHGDYVQSRRDENETIAKPESSEAAAAAKKEELSKRQAVVKERTATLRELSETVVAKWPGKEEADEARGLLGQLAFEEGDYSGAYKYLSQVRPVSKRYASTQQLIGQMFWKKYLIEKKSAAEEGLEESAKTKLELSAKTFRENATKHFQTSVDVQTDELGKNETLPKGLSESRQILAQAYLESERYAEARKAVAPLIEDIEAHPPAQIDITVLRTVNLAMKISLAADDVAFAGKSLTLLADLSADRNDVNLALIDFAKLVRRETTNAQDHAAELSKAGDAGAAAAEKKAASLKSIESDLLDKLKSRKELTIGGMLYLADALNKVGKTEDSRSQYKAIIDKSEADPEFAKSAQKSLTRVRAQVIGLLRDEGKYDQAMKQVEELIAAYPKSLEPLVEKARILHAWSIVDAKKMDDAISQWTRIRTLLANMQQKPPEYFEAVLSAANLLILQAEKTKTPAKAEIAEKLLTATLRMSPAANGPDTVALYERALARAATAQGKRPTPK